MSDGINRLKSFRPFDNLTLRLSRLPADESSLGDDDLSSEFGFVTGSQQHNFFVKKGAGKVVFALHTSSSSPSSLSSGEVVARIFGVVRGSDFEIWHLSVRKGHPLNSSNSGTRWGIYGIKVIDPNATKIRFAEGVSGQQVSKSNMEKLVRGSPNPYATYCLYSAMKEVRCSVARQNEASPCSQLFDSQYSHRTHPGTLLLYRSLGFEKSPGLDGYSWNEKTMVDLDDSWRLLLFRFRLGVPVVYDDSKQRRSSLGKRARVLDCV